MKPARLSYPILRVVLLGAAMAVASCSLPTNRPLPVLSYPAPTGSPAEDKTLVVFLRGKSGSHRSFETAGMVDELQKQMGSFDILAPNTHFGYYMSRAVVDRLKYDVIDPAIAAGYREIWLVGVSLGSIGALLYLDAYPSDIDGVCLIAPYLGNSGILEPIANAGGLAHWEPSEPDPKDSWQLKIWTVLKNCHKNGFQTPPVLLGFGTGDRYHSAHQLLSADMPPAQVFEVNGGHDFVTFASAWKGILDNGLFSARPETNHTLD